MTADGRAAAFWDFSLELYAQPNVASAALALQDGSGKDVNIALYCLFTGLILGEALDATAIAVLAAAVNPWNEAAVHPLRAVRRGLKPFDIDPYAAALRQRLKAIELEAEKLAQKRLAEVALDVPAGIGSFDRARANLLAYAGDAAQPLLSAFRAALADER